MKLLKNVLGKELNIRTEKDYPIKGVEFIDIMPLFLQKDILNRYWPNHSQFLQEILQIKVVRSI